MGNAEREKLGAQLERTLRLARDTTDEVTRERLLQLAHELRRLLHHDTDGNWKMTRYYFDMRDGDQLIADEEGFELPNLEAVQREAVLSLTDQSRDVAERGVGSVAALSIDVRDQDGPVMRVTFGVEVLRTS